MNQEPPLGEVEPGHFYRCHIPIEDLRRLQRVDGGGGPDEPAAAP